MPRLQMDPQPGPAAQPKARGLSVFYTGKPTEGVPEVVDFAVRIVIG
jgi:hypothetical protein